MSSQTTANVLSEFDICLAVTQQAINSQMAYAWKSWKQRNDFKGTFEDTVNIFKKQKVKGGDVVDSKSGIDATFAPLEVNLAVQNVNLGQVEVKLTMTSGTVKYFVEGCPADPYNFKNVSITFRVNLEKSPCKLDDLKVIEPNGHKVAEATIKESGLPESVFSIEYLFLKFTDIDFEIIEAISFENGAPVDAVTVASKALTLLLHGDLAPGGKDVSKFILGTVVRRNMEEATPTFAMTDFIFDVSPNFNAVSASTLNYLGVFNKKALPPDRDTARLKLRNPWVQPSQIDGSEASIAGVMAICKEKFFDNYMMGEFTKTLGNYLKSKPNIVGLKCKFESEEVNQSQSFSDFLGNISIAKDIASLASYGNYKIDSTTNFSLDIQIIPYSDNLNISGRINLFIHGYEVDILDNFGFNRESYVELSGSCKIIGQGAGSNFSLSTHLTYNFGTPNVTKNDNYGYGVDKLSSDVFTWGKMNEAVETIAKTLGEKVEHRISEYLDSSLSTLSIQLTQHKFIPPGTSVFTFQKPIFTSAGDLLMEVIYKAP